MAKLKVGVIGLGVGLGRCREVLKSRKARLVAVAEPSEEKRRRARETLGLEDFYEDYRELIRDPEVEAVVVALPVPLHYPATMAALRAGKHVLCEKPPASNARQTRRMADLARDKGLALTYHLQLRFRSEMDVVRRVVGAGRLGTIYRAHARYVRARNPRLLFDRPRMAREGGGVCFDLGVHALDLAWHSLGCPRPTRVVAANRAAFPDWNAIERVEDMAEDDSVAMIFFENGAVVTLESSYLSQRPESDLCGASFQLLGDKGGLEYPSLRLTGGGPKAATTRALKHRARDKTDAGRRMLDNFADAAAGRAEPVITPEHGHELQRMLDAVHKSGEQGREIRLK